MSEFSHQSVRSAFSRIKPFVHRTPVFTSNNLDALAGRKLYFKAENLQKTGSFKARGALNALGVLCEKYESGCPSVVTHSSGNHGQALAYAAQMRNAKCTVVVPENAPKTKVDAIRSYGANVIYCQSNMAAREKACNEVIESTGAILVHPHDDLNVMAGQGTIALEFLEQIPDLDAILVSVGGGGMLSGIAVYAKDAKPTCKIYGVEPVGKQLGESLAAGQPLQTDHSTLLQTVADGIRVKCLGHHCFPVVNEYCEKRVFSVADADIVKAMRLIFERMKLVVEPSAAICLAAALSPEFLELPDTVKNVGIILCGGNVDLDCLPWIKQ